MIPYLAFTPFIMRTRGDASNYFSDSVDITEAEEFLREKRAQGLKGIGLLHLFVASYVRTVSQKPALNRYICGQRAYARKNIEVVMTVKRSMSENAEETSIKVIFDPRDTITDVYNRLNAAIESVKNNSTTDTDRVARTLIRTPRLILRFVVGLLNFLDYFNCMPGVILRASPFHGSMIITDIGSLGIPPIYHHLYNFGNLPLFISFGIKHRVRAIDTDGVVRERRYIDFKAVTDERITDGFTYAQCFKLLRGFVVHPRALDLPPERVFADVP